MFKDHDHFAESTAAVSASAKDDLCRLAVENSHIPLRQLYSEYCHQPAVINSTAPIPSFESCRTQMHRARQQVMPPVPSTRADIDLSGEWSLTHQGASFLLHQDEDLVIFTTDDNLQRLAASNTIFMDGTFRSYPVLFKQLYSIHGMYRDHVVPLVYCLLKDMRRATYYQILELIKRRLADLDLTLEPTTVISDFEKALVPTIRTQLPTSQHHGCLFHFSQAIWKRVQLLGLTTLYHSNHAVRDFIRKILALPFLPEAEIPTAWHSLEEDDLLLQHPLLEDLTTYFSSTWIQGAYPLSMWSAYHLRIRTNNHVEGWHSKLNTNIGRAHPNLHTLVQHLKAEQAETELTLRRARLGGAPKPPRKKYRALDAQVQRLTDQYDQQQITATQLLADLSGVVQQLRSRRDR